jgi:hypothetical protein
VFTVYIAGRPTVVVAAPLWNAAERGLALTTVGLQAIQRKKKIQPQAGPVTLKSLATIR